MGTSLLSAWLGHIFRVGPRRRALLSCSPQSGCSFFLEPLARRSEFPGEDDVQVLMGSQLVWLCHARPCPVELGEQDRSAYGSRRWNVPLSSTSSLLKHC